MRYCGLRILPIRRSRIRTATVCSLLSLVTLSMLSAPVGFGAVRFSWTDAPPGLEGSEGTSDTSALFCQIGRRDLQPGAPPRPRTGIDPAAAALTRYNCRYGPSCTRRGAPRRRSEERRLGN